MKRVLTVRIGIGMLSIGGATPTSIAHHTANWGLYESEARMGLHVDADEDAWDAPVLSISLGDTALFRIGGSLRSDPTRSVRLASGDVCLLGGASRRAYHGVDRVLPGTSRLLPKGGRINLTVRRVTSPA